ncbi:hypothetical protein K9L97_04355 [Candidatus Woesearchaeota archaeon]|nr:hypothetical protein [Candidatus Woesearchaeota archaeon]
MHPLERILKKQTTINLLQECKKKSEQKNIETGFSIIQSKVNGPIYTKVIEGTKHSVQLLTISELYKYDNEFDVNHVEWINKNLFLPKNYEWPNEYNMQVFSYKLSFHTHIVNNYVLTKYLLPSMINYDEGDIPLHFSQIKNNQYFTDLIGLVNPETKDTMDILAYQYIPKITNLHPNKDEKIKKLYCDLEKLKKELENKNISLSESNNMICELLNENQFEASIIKFADGNYEIDRKKINNFLL